MAIKTRFQGLFGGKGKDDVKDNVKETNTTQDVKDADTKGGSVVTSFFSNLFDSIEANRLRREAEKAKKEEAKRLAEEKEKADKEAKRKKKLAEQKQKEEGFKAQQEEEARQKKEKEEQEELDKLKKEQEDQAVFQQHIDEYNKEKAIYDMYGETEKTRAEFPGLDEWIEAKKERGEKIGNERGVWYNDLTRTKRTDQIIKNFFSDKARYVTDENGEFKLDEEGNRIKMKNVGLSYAMGGVLGVLTSAIFPLTFGYDAIKNAYRENISDDKKIKLQYKKEKKAFEGNEESVVNWVNNYYDLHLEIPKDLLDKSIEFQGKHKELIESLEEFDPSQKLIFQKLNNLEEIFKSKESTEEEKKKAELEYMDHLSDLIKLTVHLTDGKDVEGDSLEVTLANAQKILGGNYSVDQIINLSTKTGKNKLKEIMEYKKEYDEIAREFENRGHNKPTQRMMDTVASIAEREGIILDEEIMAEIFGNAFGNVSLYLKELPKEDEHKGKLMVGVFSDLTKHAFDNTLTEGTDMKTSLESFRKIMNSSSFLELKKELLDPKNFNIFFDGNGNIDYVAIGNYLKKNPNFKLYSGVINSLRAEQHKESKRQDVKDARTLFGVGWNKIASLWYESDLLGSYQDNVPFFQASEGLNKLRDLEGLSLEEQKKKRLEIIQNIPSDKGARGKIAWGLWNEYLKGEITYKEYIDDLENSLSADAYSSSKDLALGFIHNIQNKDDTYKQNYWNQYRDTLDLGLAHITANPRETGQFLASFSVPLLGTAGKVYKPLNLLIKANNPVTRTLLRTGAMITSEVVEGTIMQMLIDSGGTTKADSRWLWLDAGIGAIRASQFIRYGIDSAKWSKDIKAYAKGLDLTKPEDIAKLEKKLIEGGYGHILAKMEDNVSNYIEGGKIKMADLTEAIQGGAVAIKAALKTGGAPGLVQELMLAKVLDDIGEDNIDLLYRRAVATLGGDYVSNLERAGNMSKKEIVKHYLESQKIGLNEIVGSNFIKGIVEIAEKEGLNAGINKVYDDAKALLDAAISREKDTAKIAELEKTKKELEIWRAEARMLPFHISHDGAGAAFRNFQNKTDILSNTLKSKVGKGITQSVADMSGLPKEIIENIEDPKKIAELILADTEKYQKYGISVHDSNQYLKDIANAGKSGLSRSQAKRLGGILDTLEAVNNGTVKIIELPEQIKKTVTGINGFTTFVEGEVGKQAVIGMVGGLVNMVKDGKGITKNSNMIKVFTHEIGHNLMMSLKQETKDHLFNYIFKHLGNNPNVNKISILGGKNMNQGRIRYLESLYTVDNELFMEELAADLLSNAIVDGIFGGKATESIAESIIKKIEVGADLKDLKKLDNPFDFLGDRFITMMETMTKEMGVGKTPEDIRGLFYYIAANIVEGNKQTVKGGKLAKGAEGAGSGKPIQQSFFYKEADLYDEAKKYKTAEEFIKSQMYKSPAYGMSHRPTIEGSPPAYNLLEGDMLPRDVYSHPEWSIASGRSIKRDKDVQESWAAIQKIKGNPEAEITVYRASPKDELNIGDWVSFSETYAKGEASVEGVDVYAHKVKAKDVYFAGDDINEFGYFPKDKLREIRKEAHKPIDQTFFYKEGDVYKWVEDHPMNYEKTKRGHRKVSKKRAIEIGESRNPGKMVDAYSYGSEGENFWGYRVYEKVDKEKWAKDAIQKSLFDDIDFGSEEAKYFFYKENGDKISTADMGIDIPMTDKEITSYDVAKLYNTNRVENAIFDKNITAEQLGDMMPMYFADPKIAAKISAGLEANSPEFKKFVDAINYANSKQKLAEKSLLEFFDLENGKILLEKTVDGKNFIDTLSNLSPRISDDGFVEFAIQSFAKYLNMSDNKVYKELFTNYVDMLAKQNYDTEVLKKIHEAFDLMGITKGEFGARYVEFASNIEKKLVKAGIKGGLEDTVAKEMAADITSRLFVGSQGYMGVIYYNADNLTEGSLYEFAYGLMERNMKKGKGKYAENYKKIKDGLLDGTNLKLENGELLVNLMPSEKNLMKNTIEFGEKTFKRHGYEKTVFNRLSARSAEYMLLALGEMKGKITMSLENFTNFFGKISTGKNKVSMVLDNKLAKIGVEDLDLSGLYRAKTTEEIIDVYGAAVQKDKKKLVAELGEDGYNKLVSDINNIKTTGLQTEDLRFVADEMKKNLNLASEGLSVDDYFNDVLTADQIIEGWIKSEGEASKGLLPTDGDIKYDTLTKDIDIISSDAAKEKVDELIQDFAKLLEEASNEGIDSVGKHIFENDLFRPFFEVEGEKYGGKLSVEKTKGWEDTYKLDYRNKLDKIKGNMLLKMVGMMANPATVAEWNPELRGAIMKSIDNMGKTVYVGEGAMKAMIEKAGLEGKYISKREFLRIFKNQAEDFVKDGLTYSDLTNDIMKAYGVKYRKEHKYSKQAEVLLTAKTANLPGYKDLVDGYVEFLSRRHKEFGFFMEEDLKQIFNTINDSSTWRVLGKYRDRSNQASKMIGLGGNWIGLSVSDIKRLQSHAEIFHPKMFANLLFNSLNTTDKAYSVLDYIFKGIRKLERVSASAMYTTFYSLLGPGLPAMGQQLLPNMVSKMAREAAEIGMVNIDKKTIDALAEIVEQLIPSDLMKTGIMSSRPELEQISRGKGKLNKLQDGLDRLLQYQSSLTWADKALEGQVKRYSLIAAFLEQGYSKESAAKFVEGLQDIIKRFDDAGYGKYIDLDTLMRNGNDMAINIANSRLNKAIKDGLLSEVEAVKIADDISKMSKDIEPIREITISARLKTMTLFQISKNPKLVQNFIGGAVGISNMRFLSWASRKAGEYGYKIGESIIAKDRQKLAQITQQILLEAGYATRYYGMFNKLSDGGTDYEAFMSNMFLPYVTANMSFLNVPQTVWKVIRHTAFKGSPTVAEEYYAAGVSEILYDALFNLKRDATGRIAMAPLYWLNQYLKARNGYSNLSDKESAKDTNMTKMSAIPIVGRIADMLLKIGFNRIGKFNHDTSNDIIRHYNTTADKNYFLNFVLNSKVTKDMVGADFLKQQSYRVLGEPDWFGLISNFEFLRKPTGGQDIVSRQIDQYAKEKGLYQLFGGPNVGKLIDELDGILDIDKMKKALKSDGFLESEINEMINSVTEFWTEDGGELSEEMKRELLSNGSLVAKMIIGYAKMNNNAHNKALVDAGKGVTEEEKAKHRADVKAFEKEVEEKVMEEYKKNPNMVKNNAFNPKLINKIIDSGKGRFGEQERIGAIMQGMSNANKQVLKETFKSTYGKEWYRMNQHQDWFKSSIEEMAGDFDRDMVKKMYNTVLLGNETLGNSLFMTYINSAPDSPFENPITSTSAIGIYTEQSILEKMFASQGISSIGVNNPFAEINTKLWNKYNSLDDTQKEKYLPKLLDYKKVAIKSVKDHSDPITANNMMAAFAATDIEHLKEISRDKELLEMIAPHIDDYIDAVTVSQPLSDEKIMDLLNEQLFKTGGGGGKKGRTTSFGKLNDKLNDFGGFRSAFKEFVMGKTPLTHVGYKTKGNSIIPIKLGNAEAKKVIQKYEFLKPAEPVSEKTPDIVVHTVKTTGKSKVYKGKNIKGQNIYKIKTSKGTKR